MTNTLVAYYSLTGNTKKIANEISKVIGSNLFEITVAADTFPNEMFETADVAKEQRKTGNLPSLTSHIPEMSSYDKIIVAGPNWSGAVATPVVSFLKDIQGFAGQIISINTSVGQNDNLYNEDFREQANDLNVVLTVNNDAEKAIDYLK